MTTKTLIFCETCPRSEEASGSEDRGWARLGQYGKVKDVCPTCVAKAEGWRGDAVTRVPNIVGRAFEYHHGPARRSA